MNELGSLDRLVFWFVGLLLFRKIKTSNKCFVGNMLLRGEVR
jgi:hypothetical protein